MPLVSKSRRFVQPAIILLLLLVMESFFTWGSGTHAKLGHGDSQHRRVPTLVQKLMGRMPAELACGEKSMCVFSPTCVCALQPTCGPVAGKTELVLEGAGYWPSDDITVRFVPLPGPDGVLPNIAPRAAIGKYIDDTHISCKTPKLSAPCTVKVEVAVNGKSFTNDCKEFEFFPVPNLDAIAPGSTHTKGGEELTISGTDLHDAQQVLVRFAGEEDGQIWEVEGQIIVIPPEGSTDDFLEGDSVSLEPAPEPSSEIAEGTDAAELTRQIVVQAPTCLPEDEEEDPQINLPIRTNVSVSFNGQDFHPVGGPVLVHHAARLEGVLPTCAAVTGGLPLKIRGRSLFDSGGVQVHFVFPPEPKEVQVELDEEGKPIAPEEVDQEVAADVNDAEATELDEEGNPIVDDSEWRGQVVVVPAVCLSSTELLVEAIPALQMTLREQRAQERAAAAEVAEAAVAAGDLPPLDLEGNGEAEEAAESGEFDEDGNQIEYDDDGNVIDLDMFVRNIAKGGAVAVRVLVTLDGGTTFVGASDAPAKDEPECDEDGNPLPIQAPEPDGFTLNYYKPEGGFTLDPPCGPRCGGTTVQVNASWLVPSSEAKVKFSKGEFTAAAVAPCEPPPAPPSTHGDAAPESAPVNCEEGAEEADAESDEPADATDAGPGCSLEVTLPELGQVEPPPATADSTVEATEDGETEDATEAEETEDGEDGEVSQKLQVQVPPVEVEVSLALDGEEYCEDITPFTYYEEPSLTSVEPAPIDGGVEAGGTVILNGQSFKLKGFEELATIKLSSEEPKIEVVIGASEGLTVQDRSISFPMPDFAARLKELFEATQVAAAAAATGEDGESEVVQVEGNGDSVTEGVDDEQSDADISDADKENQDEPFTVTAFNLKVELSLNSQQFHSGSDPENEEEPLQVQFTPIAVEED